MVMRLYAIYDRVAEEAGPVFEQKNHGTARRAFQRYLSDHPQSVPDDFDLLWLGEVDHDKCTVKANIMAVRVDDAASLASELSTTSEESDT